MKIRQRFASRWVGAGSSCLVVAALASPAAAGDAAPAAPAACAAEQAVADGAGTVTNLSSLGACLEKAGKLVRAEAVFKKLGDAARAAGDKDAESSAASHVAAIDARTPKLRVEVVGELGELVVELDGVALGASDLGLARPVDPGDHVIRVRKGASVLKTDDVIVIEMSKQTYTVDVAALTGAKAAPPATTAPPAAAPGPSASAAQPVGPPPSSQLDLRAPDDGKGSSDLAWMGPLGTTAIAVGTVAVLTFAGLEIGALAMKGTADCTTLPNDSDACTSVGFDQLATARTLAEVGQWVGVGGAVVLATGIGFAVGYGASSDAKKTSLLVAPTPGGATLVLGGTL
jgi:hypothetical protein